MHVLMLLCTENNFLLCVFPLSEEKRKGKAKQKPEADVVVVVLCLCFAHFMKWLLSSSGSPNIPFHACFMHHPQTKQIHFISQANKAKQCTSTTRPLSPTNVFPTLLPLPCAKSNTDSNTLALVVF